MNFKCKIFKLNFLKLFITVLLINLVKIQLNHAIKSNSSKSNSELQKSKIRKRFKINSKDDLSNTSSVSFEAITQTTTELTRTSQITETSNIIPKVVYGGLFVMIVSFVIGLIIGIIVTYIFYRRVKKQFSKSLISLGNEIKNSNSELNMIGQRKNSNLSSESTTSSTIMNAINNFKDQSKKLVNDNFQS